MRLLFAALELVVLLSGLAAAIAAARAWMRRRWAADAPWRLNEESDGEMVSLYAERPGQQRLMIGAVPFASSDFDFRIEELRAEGQGKLAALNSGRRTISR